MSHYGRSHAIQQRLDRAWYTGAGVVVTFLTTRGGRTCHLGVIVLDTDDVLRVDESVSAEAEVLLANVDQADVTAVAWALWQAPTVFPYESDASIWAVTNGE